MSFDLANFTIAAPLLALAAGALVILLLDLILPARSSHASWYVVGTGAVALAGYYLVPIWGQHLVGFGGALVVDQLSLVFTAIVLVTTFLTLLLATTRAEEDKSGYLALILFAAMGMVIMTGSGNLLTVFLGLELLSLALYVTIAFDPNRPLAYEAALKYFVLGSVASGFVLFGFALIYGVTGTMDMALIANQAAGSVGHLYYKAGMALTLVGIAFKLALVPFHAWAPDVYEGAPTPSTAFMSVGSKAAAFAMLARFLVATVPAEAQNSFLLPLAVLGGLSMIVGASVGIWQTDLKRLMGYSGITTAGYLIMGLPGLSNSGFSAGAYYLAAYCFASFGIFAIISLMEREGEDGASLQAFSGLFYRKPALAIAMTILMFGLAGLPPSGGFIGKFLLAKAAIGASGVAPFNVWTLLIALMLSTGISAYVYLRVVGTMFRKPADQAAIRRAVMAGGQDQPFALSNETVRYALEGVLIVAVVATIYLGVLPNGLIHLLTTTIAR